MFIVFFFNDTATTEIYTLSLHDALPISFTGGLVFASDEPEGTAYQLFLRSGIEAAVIASILGGGLMLLDRKSTRLNSSHANISYAVFCLKKKNKIFIVDKDDYLNSILIS